METETETPIIATTKVTMETIMGEVDDDSDLEGSVSDDLIIDMDTNNQTTNVCPRSESEFDDENSTTTNPTCDTRPVYVAKCDKDGGELRVPEPRVIFELLAKEHRKRRLRTVFSDSQIHTLEQAFRFSPYINTEVRCKLSEITGLSDNAIQIWFQNRRARQRKTGDNSTLDSPPDQYNDPQGPNHPSQPPVILVPVSLATIAKQPSNSQTETASSVMLPTNHTEGVKVPVSSLDQGEGLNSAPSSVSVGEQSQTVVEVPTAIKTDTPSEAKPTTEQNSSDPDFEFIEKCPLCPEKFTCRRSFAGHLEEVHHCLMPIADCQCCQCTQNPSSHRPKQQQPQRLTENSFADSVPTDHRYETATADCCSEEGDPIQGDQVDPDYDPLTPDCPPVIGSRRKRKRNSRKSAKTLKRSSVKQHLSKTIKQHNNSNRTYDITDDIIESQPCVNNGLIRQELSTADSNRASSLSIIPSNLTTSNSSPPISTMAACDPRSIVAAGNPALVLPTPNTTQSGFVLLPVSFNGSMTCLTPRAIPGSGGVSNLTTSMFSALSPPSQVLGDPNSKSAVTVVRKVLEEPLTAVGGGLTRRSSKSSSVPAAPMEDRPRAIPSPVPTRSDSPSSDDSPHFSDLTQFLNGVTLHPLKPIHSPTPPPRVEEKKHMCEICGGLFAMPSGLKRHMLNHTDTRNYQCKICNKRFKLSHHLDNHLKMHLGLKESCPQCPAKFTQSYALKQHVMRVHHSSRQAKKLREVRVNVEKHQCHICNTVLANSTELSTHVSQHVNRKHICDLCGKDFAVSYQLAKHRRQHEKRPFMCIACGDLFGTMESLTFHQGFCTDIMEKDLKNGKVESAK